MGVTTQIHAKYIYIYHNIVFASDLTFNYTSADPYPNISPAPPVPLALSIVSI